MAEKATMGNALVLMLSYPNNPDGTLPDSARAFRYKDVQDFMKRLRKAYGKHYQISPKGEISYIVAGELGSETKRVHWHMILFSKRSLHPLGEWSSLRGEPMSGPKITHKGWNQNWSIWSDHYGYVCPQVPDQGGVAYVLKYAMKDQFNLVNAEGTQRFTKCERHAAGMFRMSKKPAIGWRYLQQQIDRWEERGSVPPDLLVKIPDYSGYWWPRGAFRKAALKALHDVNLTINEECGRDAPQWNTLLASLAAREADQQLLILRQKQVEWEYDQRQQNSQLQDAQKRQTLRQRAAIAAGLLHDTKPKTGAVLTRDQCAELSDGEWRNYKIWFEAEYNAEKQRQARPLTVHEFDQLWTIKNGGGTANPFHPDRLYPEHEHA